MKLNGQRPRNRLWYALYLPMGIVALPLGLITLIMAFLTLTAATPMLVAAWMHQQMRPKDWRKIE